MAEHVNGLLFNLEIFFWCEYCVLHMELSDAADGMELNWNLSRGSWIRRISLQFISENEYTLIRPCATKIRGNMLVADARNGFVFCWKQKRHNENENRIQMFDVNETDSKYATWWTDRHSKSEQIFAPETNGNQFHYYHYYAESMPAAAVVAVDSGYALSFAIQSIPQLMMMITPLVTWLEACAACTLHTHSRWKLRKNIKIKNHRSH